MKNLRYFFILLTGILISACMHAGKKQQSATTQTDTVANGPKAEMPLSTVNPPRATGSVERLSSDLDNIIPADSKPEIIAEGFVWSEGPVWLPVQKKLLFSDIPRNSIFQWSEAEGLSLYIDSAGFPGPPRSDGAEIGSNGLVLDASGNLVLCQHGNRQIARMDAPLDHPRAKFITLADKYDGKRLNSPNDLVYSSKGDLYFTDPPYGLPNQGAGPEKELSFQGVFKLSAAGELTVVDDKLSRPNGIGLSPDEKTLYVSNSDIANRVWMAYELNKDGFPVKSRVLFDASEYLKGKAKMGVPDGLTVNKQGIIFGAGPGGIYVITPEGKLAGIINTGYSTSNCTLNEDGSMLFITADMYLMRIRLK